MSWAAVNTCSFSSNDLWKVFCLLLKCGIKELHSLRLHQPSYHHPKAAWRICNVPKSPKPESGPGNQEARSVSSRMGGLEQGPHSFSVSAVGLGHQHRHLCSRNICQTVCEALFVHYLTESSHHHHEVHTHIFRF